jgi:hypothetical protein
VKHEDKHRGGKAIQNELKAMKHVFTLRGGYREARAAISNHKIPIL